MAHGPLAEGVRAEALTSPAQTDHGTVLRSGSAALRWPRWDLPQPAVLGCWVVRCGQSC